MPFSKSVTEASQPVLPRPLGRPSSPSLSPDRAGVPQGRRKPEGRSAILRAQSGPWRVSGQSSLQEGWGAACAMGASAWRDGPQRPAQPRLATPVHLQRAASEPRPRSARSYPRTRRNRATAFAGRSFISFERGTYTPSVACTLRRSPSSWAAGPLLGSTKPKLPLLAIAAPKRYIWQISS